MTTAIGNADIAWRMGAIERMLAARSGVSAGTANAGVSWTPPESPVGFDPFGAAYQEALGSAGITPAAAGEAATSASPATSSWFGGNVAVRRVASVSHGVFTATRADGQVGGSRTVGQIGGYGQMPVPADLAAYGNGNIPPEALEPIGQGGHRLWAPAAESYKQLVAAAKVDGIDLTVTDSYRSYDQQVDLAEQKGLYADGGLAAVPGTSNHGWGLAVDFNVNTPAALEWLRTNGHSFGFVEASKREPWHWEFRPDQA